MKPIFTMIILLNIFISNISAQDSQYWTLQYGTHSTLLGGAVIGSVSDLGATYYNPGMLALIEDPAFILGGAIYQYTQIKFKNALPGQRDLTSSSINSTPTLTAGSFRFPGLPKHTFGYSILTRSQSRIEFSFRDAVVIGNTGAPGNETLNSDFSYLQEIDDDWLGITWAYSPAKKIGIGITPYLSVRSQDANIRTTAFGILPDDNVTNVDILNEFEYDVWRFLTKIGFGYQSGAFSTGITITTPSLQVFGDGESAIRRLVSGSPNGNNFVNSDFQENVKANYKSSWTVGSGIGYEIGNTRLHFAFEWFNAVKKFRILETEDFVGQTTGDSIGHNITLELNSLINFGLGAETMLSKNVQLYGSFITDFSAANSRSIRNTTVTNWDLFQFAAGTSFEIKKVELNLGVTHEFGSREVPPPTSEDNAILGVSDPEDIKLSTNITKFIFGFAFRF